MSLQRRINERSFQQQRQVTKHNSIERRRSGHQQQQQLNNYDNTEEEEEEEEDFAQTKVRYVGAHPLWGTLSRRVLDPIKLAHSPSRPDGRLR